MSDKMKTLYFGQHWPAPRGQAEVKLTAEVAEELSAEGFWDYFINIELADGRTFGLGGGVEAKSKEDAERRVLNKTINHLASTLAELAEEVRKAREG